MVLGAPTRHLATTAIGALQGLITIFLKVPSFIVTLGGSLFWEGVALYLIDSNNAGGSIPINGGALWDIVNENLSPLFTWIFSLVVAGGMSYLIFNKDRSRTREWARQCAVNSKRSSRWCRWWE